MQGKILAAENIEKIITCHVIFSPNKAAKTENNAPILKHIITKLPAISSITKNKIVAIIQMMYILIV